LEKELGVQEILKGNQLSLNLAEQILKLWQLPSLKKVYESNRKIHLSSAAYYYFENCIRFASPGFIPNEEDLIRARSHSYTVSETQIHFSDVFFTLVDVGGQRAERRKWLSCFKIDKVTCVIYFVSLDEYDMVLQEDNQSNGLKESLEQFAEVSGSKWFNKTPIILFLNKSDIFAKKIQKIGLSSCFEECDVELGDFENAVEYIKERFRKRFNGWKLYTFVLSAVNRGECMNAMEGVLKAVEEVLKILEIEERDKEIIEKLYNEQVLEFWDQIT